MPAQSGKAMLLKIENTVTPDTYDAVGGFRTNSMTLNQETIDITNKDSAGNRELLSGGGVKSLSVSGSGVFADAAALTRLQSLLLAGTTEKFQMITPGLGEFVADCAITSLEMSGEHNGEVTWSISLESSGAITFTAE